MMDVECVFHIVVDVNFEDCGVAFNMSDNYQVVGWTDSKVFGVAGVICVPLTLALLLIVGVVSRVGKSHEVTDALPFTSVVWK